MERDRPESLRRLRKKQLVPGNSLLHQAALHAFDGVSTRRSEHRPPGPHGGLKHAPHILLGHEGTGGVMNGEGGPSRIHLLARDQFQRALYARHNGRVARLAAFCEVNVAPGAIGLLPHAIDVCWRRHHDNLVRAAADHGFNRAKPHRAPGEIEKLLFETHATAFTGRHHDSHPHPRSPFPNARQHGKAEDALRALALRSVAS